MEKITGVITNDNTLSGQITTQDNLSCVLVENVQVTGNIMETMLAGLSAYEIAVKNGFIGTEQEWLDSLSYGSTLIGENGIVITDREEDDTTVKVISVSDEILNKADLDSPDFTGVPTAPTADVNNIKDIHQIVNVEFLDNTIKEIFVIDSENDIVTVHIDNEDVTLPTIKLLENYPTKEFLDDNYLNGENFDNFIRENGLPYSIKIGDNIYNGTQDVVVPIYNGATRE